MIEIDSDIQKISETEDFSESALRAKNFYQEKIQECASCLGSGDISEFFDNKLPEAEDSFIKSIKLNGSLKEKFKILQMETGFSLIQKMNNLGCKETLNEIGLKRYSGILKRVEKLFEKIKLIQDSALEKKHNNQILLRELFRKIEDNFFKIDYSLKETHGYRRDIELFKKHIISRVDSESIITNNAILNLEDRFDKYRELYEKYEEIFNANEIIKGFKRRIISEILKEIRIRQLIKAVWEKIYLIDN